MQHTGGGKRTIRDHQGFLSFPVVVFLSLSTCVLLSLCAQAYSNDSFINSREFLLFLFSSLPVSCFPASFPPFFLPSSFFSFIYFSFFPSLPSSLLPSFMFQIIPDSTCPQSAFHWRQYSLQRTQLSTEVVVKEIK